MLLSSLVDKAWRLCLLLGSFFLFLQIWGPPLWLDSFPQSSVFRLMDALYGDLLATLLVLTPRVLGVSSWIKTLSDILAGAFLMIFAALALTSRSLREWDIALRVLVVVVAALSMGQAIFRLYRPVRDQSRFLDWLLVFAGSLVLVGMTLDLGVPELHSLVLGFWGGSLLVGWVLLSFISPLNQRPISFRKANRGKPFSSREWEVLDHLKDGKTNQEIASALFISLATVKSHLSHMQRKTGARNRVEVLRIILSEDDISAFRRMEGPIHDEHAQDRRKP